MVIVTLKDGTSYNIDTDSTFNAESIVEYKLRQRLDYRKIKNAQLVSGVIMDINSDGYNSGNQFDGVELNCSDGWSYKYD